MSKDNNIIKMPPSSPLLALLLSAILLHANANARVATRRGSSSSITRSTTSPTNSLPLPHFQQVVLHEVGDNDHSEWAPLVASPQPMAGNSSSLPTVALMNPSDSLFHEHPLLAALAALLMLALILATLLGNLGVCLAIALVRKLKAQPANLLLISLALADFCVGLFVMPMAAVYLLQNRWVFGEFLCRFWVTADLTLCTASILNLCAISVDRHLAVTRALRYSAIRTRRRICAYICVVWVGALLVSAAPLALLPFPDTSQHCQVSQNRFYQIYATIISFWGPSLIMVIVYYKLWSSAKRMQRQDRLVLRWQGMSPASEQLEERPIAHQNGGGPIIRNNSVARANAHFLFALRKSAQKFRHDKNNNSKEDGNNNNNNSNGLANGGRASAGSALGTIRIPLLNSSSQKPQYEDKARKTLGVIMSVFIICWVPFFILALAKSQRWMQHVPRWLDSLALWLGYSNSMLNPLIYCKYNREFRIPFGEMICCRFRTIQDVMRNESYYMKFGSPRISESRSAPRSARNGMVVRTDRSYTQNTVTDGQQLRQKENGLEIDARRLSSKRNSSPCVFSESS